MIIVAWPYDPNSMNIISLINEVAVSAYLYISFLLTDYPDTMSATIDYSHTKDILSWFLTSILMLTIFINTIYTLDLLTVRLFAYCRRVRERNREILRRDSISYRRAQQYNHSLSANDAT
jgi:hypothetical protein